MARNPTRPERAGHDHLETWPFWAPSRASAVADALDLAAVGPGMRFVDLGCGDGQVLLAAAQRGATVTGVEADLDLVDEARSNLAASGAEATVLAGDLFDRDLDLDADVFFSYLAPATLQRLLPTLQANGRARLVTVDFDVPGLVPNRRAGDARLYVLPGRRRKVGRPGWPSAGTLVATVPDHQSLSCLDLVHPGGPVDLRVGRPLQPVATAVTGASSLTAPGHLAVDIRWEPMALGTTAAGWLRVDGVADHAVFVVTTDDDEGMWELTDSAVRGLFRALRRRRPPTTIEDLLAATA